MDDLVKRNPAEPEFHQTVHEIAESVVYPNAHDGKRYSANAILPSSDRRRAEGRSTQLVKGNGHGPTNSTELYRLRTRCLSDNEQHKLVFRPY